MKKILIIGLILLNAALLVAVLTGPTVEPAQAQLIGGGTDYMMLTAHTREGRDGVFVIDLGRQRMAGFQIDPRTRRLIRFRRGVQLDTDFQVGGQTGR